MRRIIVGILIVTFSFLFSVSWAQESNLIITDMKVEPSTVNPGDKALLSCRVNHSNGPMLIERVAAITSSKGWNTLFPSLYDDGTHGDKVPGDGIFSLEVQAANKSGEVKVVFSAVDKDRNEVESKPIFLIVK